MSLFKSNQQKIIENFKKVLNKEKKKYSSPLHMITRIRSHFNRTELMIIDSGLKNMPLSTLNKTLLLKQDVYFETLQNITDTLKNIKNTI